MDLETRHLLAIVLLVAAGVGFVLATLISQRIRDWALFGLVFCSVIMERMDVTFLGTYWYRGTSRGIQVSAVDLMALGILVATLLVPRYRQSRFYWPASFGFMILFVGYCAASISNADRPLYGIWELAKLGRGLMVFLAAALFIRTRREMAIVVAALSCTCIFEAFNGIEQRLFKGATRIPGTLNHENTLSTYLCMVGPILVAGAMSDWDKRLRWLAGFAWIMAAGAELLTLSRMGVPVFFLVNIGAAVACSSWKPTKEKILVVAGAALLLSAFIAVSWKGLEARYLQGDVKAELTDEHAVETRGVYWRTAMAMIHDHPYGVGLNNWSYSVSKVYGKELSGKYVDYDDIVGEPAKDQLQFITLPPAADSLPSLLIGELGIAGAVVFLLYWFRWFQMGLVFLGNRLNPDPMHRMAIGILLGTFGIFLQSITEWTYKQPQVLFTCHVLTGALASCYWLRKKRKKAAKADEVIEGEFVDDENFVRAPLPQPEVL